MPERPGDDRSGPGFGWLYGGGGSADGSSEDPDATRAIPQQPRPGASGSPDDESTRVMPAQSSTSSGASGPRQSPPRTAPRPVAPPPSGTGRGGGLGSGRPRFRLRYLGIVLLLWLVFLVATPIFAWSKVDKVEWEPGGKRPDDQPGTTYLLVGSDSRKDLSKAERRKLGTGGAEGQRTDTIMLLHTGSGPNLLMSIPRDSIVPVPGHGTGKINAAFAYGGAPLLTRTIEQDTGIRVDQYVEIGFGGFVDLVDAVGGIEICPEQAMKDKLANLDIKKGCQDADGVTALGYARSRHTSGIGDIDRIRHQREVVSAIGHKAASPWSVLNPVRYWKLNMAATQAVTFGEGAGPVRAGLFASAMTHVDKGSGGLTCSVPIADLAVHWDEERSQEMFGHIIADETDKITPSLCSPTGGVQ